MSGADQRLSVFPTRMTLGQLQGRVKSAEKGKSLIKRKADALQIKHKEIAGELYRKKIELEKQMENAFFLLTKAKFYGGDLRLAMHQAKTNSLSIKIDLEHVAGMNIPVYSIPEEIKQQYFVGQSGKLIGECRMQFLLCFSLMTEIASMQTSFNMLDTMLMATNRRVNALEHIMIPRLENTISYVQSELDEQDREEFFRLKKVQAKK
ncbi:V-type H+-transporting ATPase subunit D [Nematocida sp. AWRm77]|nr:V-type H+-transporting ATPase subunit D [Nematocida sp. AWRm77]